MLVSREKGKFLGVTLWDIEEHGRLAGGRLDQEPRTGVDEMGANSPIPEFYEVVAKK